jgi:SpoVK/Ycf46/Vps4 family AAA+-type ATPase
VLIDEVETLTASRQGGMSGSEPGDAVRVVNAVLTQLDHIKTLKNVLVLATSNLTDAIDPAFLDRADLVRCVLLLGLRSRPMHQIWNDPPPRRCCMFKCWVFL